MDIQLADKLALVTGGGAGIGRGIALTLAEAGATVLAADRDHAGALETAEQIAAQGGRAEALAADISDEQDVRRLFGHIGQRYDSLHVLVNNAGINLFKGIADTAPDEWDRIFAVDLRGVYLVTRAALPLLTAAGGASVVNIASVHAQLTLANITAYAAAKGGVVSMGRSLAQELGASGVRVNTVSPGFVATPLLERWFESQADPQAARRRVDAYHPLGRIGTPRDIAALVTFLASESAAFITGANIVIDGGLSTRLMH